VSLLDPRAIGLIALMAVLVALGPAIARVDRLLGELGAEWRRL
jgi:hypothetical protein